MARPLRLNLAGVWYHVTGRGNDRKAIYRDDRDPMHFVELFSPWRERFRVRLRAPEGVALRARSLAACGAGRSDDRRAAARSDAAATAHHGRSSRVDGRETSGWLTR